MFLCMFLLQFTYVRVYVCVLSLFLFLQWASVRELARKHTADRGCCASFASASVASVSSLLSVSLLDITANYFMSSSRFMSRIEKDYKY